jgi:cytochrome c biogenesis protein ResB
MEVDALAKPDAASPSPPPSPSLDAQPGVPIWFRSPWSWFFSLGVGVTLLVVLAIASTAGTLINPLERAQALVFYTWWYKLLLLALAINMSCATVKTVMQKLLPSRALRVQAQRRFYDTAPLSVRIPFAGSAADAARAFQRKGFEARHEGDAGVARSGWLGRFGAPVSHVGLVIVLVAGFASSWVASEGLVQIPEGRSTTTMQMRPDLTVVQPLGFAIALDDFSTGFFPQTRIPSHYLSTVTVREGDEVLYSGPVEVNHSPRIMGWRLHQTSYQELPMLPRHEVEVNGPVLGEPVTVEASPGQTVAIPGAEGMSLALDARMGWSITSASTRVAAGSLASGSSHGAGLSVLATQFEPDFVMGEDRQATSRSAELNNPALNVTLKSEGKPLQSQWLFGREDMRAFTHASSSTHTLALVDVVHEEPGHRFVVEVADAATSHVLGRVLLELGQEVAIEPHDHGEAAAPVAASEDGWTATIGKPVTGYATVLTLTRNPAIPTIYFGCVLMMIGLFMSFFVPRRDVWFLRDAAKGELRVVAHYRHPSRELDRTTAAVLASLQAPAPQAATSPEAQ